jgi:hypothetical protein
MSGCGASITSVRPDGIGHCTSWDGALHNMRRILRRYMELDSALEIDSMEFLGGE